MSGFYSHLVQNCDEHVKVMTEVDMSNGTIVGIESVKPPDEVPTLACPLSRFPENKMNALKIEGSSVKCQMECRHRMIERA